jgi:hypothetical protein
MESPSQLPLFLARAKSNRLWQSPIQAEFNDSQMTGILGRRTQIRVRRGRKGACGCLHSSSSPKTLPVLGFT